MAKNLVILEGYLNNDELKLNTTNTAGKAVLNFQMCTNRRWNDAQGQKVERADWHKVVVWDKLAQLCATYMYPKCRVLVEGRLETRDYTVIVEKQCVNDAGQVLVNPQNNQPYTVKVPEKRYVTEIVARDVQFLSKKDGVATAPAAGTAAGPGTVQATVAVPPVSGAAVAPPVQTVAGAVDPGPQFTGAGGANTGEVSIPGI